MVAHGCRNTFPPWIEKEGCCPGDCRQAGRSHSKEEADTLEGKAYRIAEPDRTTPETHFTGAHKSPILLGFLVLSLTIPCLHLFLSPSSSRTSKPLHLASFHFECPSLMSTRCARIYPSISFSMKLSLSSHAALAHPQHNQRSQSCCVYTGLS